MKFENMVSFTEIDYNDPITEFSENYKKSHPERMVLLSEYKKEIAVFSGLGYRIDWTTPHDCGCSHCNHDTEEHGDFFYRIEEAEEFRSSLKLDPYNEDIDIVEFHYIRAVKQIEVKK